MKRSRAGVATGLLLTTAAALAVPALAQPSRKQPAQPAPTTEPTPPPPTQGAEPAVNDGQILPTFHVRLHAHAMHEHPPRFGQLTELSQQHA